jgi:hypothetical protein
MAVTDAAGPSSAEAPSPSISWRLTWGLIGLGILLFFFVLAHDVEGDGRSRLNALESLLGGGGIPNTKYPLVGSLLATPLVLLGHVVGSTDWWVSRFNMIVYAAGLGLLFRLLRGQLPGDVLAGFLLLLGTTAMFPNALSGFGAETFSAMAAGTGLVAWSQGRWKTATVLLALGVANQPATIGGLALALGWWAWRFKRARAVVPVVAAAALWLLDNLVRRGSLLKSGYEGDHGFPTLLPFSGLPGFSYPTLFGAGSLLLSTGKGLLFFTPGLALLLGRGAEALRPVREIVWMWLLFIGGMVAVYGSWWAWYGGYSWGPRFLLVASLPATLVLSAVVRRPPAGLLAATAVLLVFALSVWVGVDGETYGLFAQTTCTANHYFLESFCWYMPEFSVLWTPLVFHAPFSWRYPALFAYALGVSIYVAWPLITRWWGTLRRSAAAASAAHRAGPGWRF